MRLRSTHFSTMIPIPIKFISKTWQPQFDTNGGSYQTNGQINFDTVSAANSMKWVLWSEAMLCIPLSITIAGYSDTCGATPFSATMKGCGWLSIVDKLQVSANSVSAVNANSELARSIFWRKLRTLSPAAATDAGANVAVHSRRSAVVLLCSTRPTV